MVAAAAGLVSHAVKLSLQPVVGELLEFVLVAETLIFNIGDDRLLPDEADSVFVERGSFFMK